MTVTANSECFKINQLGGVIGTINDNITCKNEKKTSH